MIILAIDPGRDKSGVVVAEDQVILARSVVPTVRLAVILRDWGTRYGVTQVVLGDRTGQDEVRRHLAVELPGIPISIGREENTTLLARRRYFADHPPRGWRRLLPLSMQVPPEPYDDYAAVIILERFLETGRLSAAKHGPDPGRV